MMPNLEIIHTLQMLFQDTADVARGPPQNTIYLQLLPCLAQDPSAFTPRCPTDKEGRGGLEPPPEDLYVFHSFKPCIRQSKQKCQFWKLSRRCRRHYKIQLKSQDYLIKLQYFCNFSLVWLSIHPRSRRGAQRIRKGEGSWSRPPKTSTRWSHPPKTFTCFIRLSPAYVNQNKQTLKPCRRQAKQTLKTIYHRKIQNFSNYPPCGNDANFGNCPDAADVIIRYNRSRKVTSSKYNIFATSTFSRSASIRVHVEVPNGKGRARGVGAAPRRLLRVSFVRALQTSSKTNKRSSPADVKHNKRSRVCHRKIQNISNFLLEMMPML